MNASSKLIKGDSCCPNIDFTAKNFFVFLPCSNYLRSKVKSSTLGAINSIVIVLKVTRQTKVNKNDVIFVVQHYILWFYVSVIEFLFYMACVESRKQLTSYLPNKLVGDKFTFLIDFVYFILQVFTCHMLHDQINSFVFLVVDDFFYLYNIRMVQILQSYQLINADLRFLSARLIYLQPILVNNFHCENFFFNLFGLLSYFIYFSVFTLSDLIHHFELIHFLVLNISTYGIYDPDLRRKYCTKLLLITWYIQL